MSSKLGKFHFKLDTRCVTALDNFAFQFLIIFKFIAVPSL